MPKILTVVGVIVWTLVAVGVWFGLYSSKPSPVSLTPAPPPQCAPAPESMIDRTPELVWEPVVAREAPPIRYLQDLKPGESGWVCCLYLTQNGQVYMALLGWEVLDRLTATRNIHVGVEPDGTYWVTPPRGARYRPEGPNWKPNREYHAHACVKPEERP